MGYLTPSDDWIRASWQDHRNRNPPSGEPGTDIATAYGTDLRMPADGVVSVVDPSPSGAEGRRVSIDLDDGRRVSFIHLRNTVAWVGMRVSRGQFGVAWSGASGHGSDWGYAEHVHVSLWARPGLPYWDTLDFMAYVETGEPDPEPEPDDQEDDMPIGYYAKGDLSPSVYFIDQTTGYRRAVGEGELTSAQSFNYVTGGKYGAGYVATMSQATFDAIPVADPATSSATLTGPAWAIGALLGLIGLVEVVRLVIDLLN
jgi:murein DD-endopeptidase